MDSIFHDRNGEPKVELFNYWHHNVVLKEHFLEKKKQYSFFLSSKQNKMILRDSVKAISVRTVLLFSNKS